MNQPKSPFLITNFRNQNLPEKQKRKKKITAVGKKQWNWKYWPEWSEAWTIRLKRDDPFTETGRGPFPERENGFMDRVRRSHGAWSGRTTPQERGTTILFCFFVFPFCFFCTERNAVYIPVEERSRKLNERKFLRSTFYLFN